MYATSSNSAITLFGDGISPRQTTFAKAGQDALYPPSSGNHSRRGSGESYLLSPTYAPQDLERNKQYPTSLQDNAARRWAHRNRDILVPTFYVLYTLLLLAPSIFTPAVIYLLIIQDARKGKSNPFLADGILVVLTTSCCVINTGITLLMKGMHLFEAPWVQNLLTGIGCVATLCAIRSSVQLPVLQP